MLYEVITDSFKDALFGHTGAFQQAGGRGAALAEDGEEDMFGRDIFVFQAVGFFVRQVNNALHAWGDENLPGAAAKDIGFGTVSFLLLAGCTATTRITSYNVCYTKLLRHFPTAGAARAF